MVVTKLANCQLDTVIGAGANKMDTDSMTGIVGEKWTDFFVEILQIANGSILDSIAKITKWILDPAHCGLAEMWLELLANVLVPMACILTIMT